MVVAASQLEGAGHRQEGRFVGGRDGRFDCGRRGSRGRVAGGGGSGKGEEMADRALSDHCVRVSMRKSRRVG